MSDSTNKKRSLVDENKKLNVELSKNNIELNLLNQALGIAGLGIWQFEIATNSVTWTKEVYDIYELDPSHEAPRLEDILHFSGPEEREEIAKTIDNGLSKGEAYAIDCSIKTKSGKLKHLHATGKPFFDAGKKLTHLIGTVTDITDRKNMEKKLKFSDYTIESFPDAIFWIDEKAKFYRVNSAASKALGYSKAELLGKTGSDINPDFTINKSQKIWSETRKTQASVFETMHRKKNGDTFPVEITNNVFEYEGKEFRCSIVRNISERLKKRQEILEALAEVERLKNQLENENVYLKEEIKLSHNFDEIISQNKNYHKLLHQVEQVAHSDATVLITGESGTGKELLARAVHHLSGRKDRPLVKINCAALPTNLIESELFGHEKGAFTGAIARKIGRFELADKGTVFLDEIGELPLELQPKLLRVLQEGELERLGGTKTIQVEVRVIAATNRELEKEIINGNFREDLFYRLNVFPIHSPPLRERPEDIPLLVNHFVSKYSKKLGKKVKTISQKTMDRLTRYDWPGNIRELQNLVERGMIISQSNQLTIGDWLPNKAQKNSNTLLSMEEMEKTHIIRALELTQGKVSGSNGAAQLLKMNAKTLDSRMRKFNIKHTSYVS